MQALKSKALETLEILDYLAGFVVQLLVLILIVPLIALTDGDTKITVRALRISELICIMRS